MKTLLILLLALHIRHSALQDNPLDALVFDFSSGFSPALPSDGWVKISFNVVHYRENIMQLKFNATCLESNLELVRYPQSGLLHCKPGTPMEITFFMNGECGMLENLPAGKHPRTIQFEFVEPLKKDTLTFSQVYLIETN